MWHPLSTFWQQSGHVGSEGKTGGFPILFLKDVHGAIYSIWPNCRLYVALVKFRFKSLPSKVTDICVDLDNRQPFPKS